MVVAKLSSKIEASLLYKTAFVFYREKLQKYFQIFLRFVLAARRSTIQLTASRLAYLIGEEGTRPLPDRGGL